MGPDSRPLRQVQVLMQETAGEALLLHLDSGQYYSLDEVGGRIWSLCDGSRTVREIATWLAEEYDQSPDVIEADVLELLQELADEQMVAASD